MLRTASKADFSALAALEAEWSVEPWSEGAFSSFAESLGAHTLVWEEEGNLCGYCTFRFAADYGELFNVAVKEDCRRRGIAGNLLSAALSLARESGVRSFTLEVRESNAGARRLYESHGFEVCDRRKNFYKSPAEDALVYLWEER